MNGLTVRAERLPAGGDFAVDIMLLVALIILNGLFAMSEIALVTAKKSRLRRLAESGDRSALTAMRLGEEPTRFLSTIQIGITAIGLLSGIVGEAALSQPLALWLRTWGIAPGTASVLAIAIVVACVTFLSIVVGELAPKRIGQANAEAIARLMARPIAFLSILGRPFVLALSVSTDSLLKLLGNNRNNAANLTEEDIHAMLDDGSQAGVLQKREHAMVKNVFRLDDRHIASLMTPRSEVVFLDIEKPLSECLPHLIESNYSRFPVCRGGMENVIGVISAKLILKKVLDHDESEIEKLLLPAVFVPESLTGIKLLEQFRESGVKMVFVVDEYGEILGLVTLQNLLEALAGEFKHRDPEDAWAVQREDGSWLLDGLIPIHELKDRLALNSVPDEAKGRYNTLGGMMMWLIGNMPHTGDSTLWEGWRLEVVDLDGNRVDKVLASTNTNAKARRIAAE